MNPDLQSLQAQLIEDGVFNGSLITYLTTVPDIAVRLTDSSVLLYSPCMIGGERTWMSRSFFEYVKE
jgi:hypothetical protein